MKHLIISKPEQGEYNPYYDRYINLVEGNDILLTLTGQKEDIKNFFQPISDEKGEYRYAPEKWSIKEVLGHILESERVFAYRALFFARKSEGKLPGYDHTNWVALGKFNSIKLKDLVDELLTVRNSNLLLFGRFNEDDWLCKGVANNYQVTVRTLAYLIAGHASHHLNVLKELYIA
jgi:hypothetical protein